MQLASHAAINSHHTFLIACALFLAAMHKAAHGVSDPTEVTSLLAMKESIGDGLNRLSNWMGDDPCETPRWTGVYCAPIDGTQYISELRLMNMNFTGILAPHVGNLTHLSILNLMWNTLQGPIPPEIGKLNNLSLLLFDGNEFSGTLPPELGNLSKLNRLQIDSNNLSGPLPPSLQGLSSVRHIHLNNNSLTGNIPKELGQLPQLLHLLLDNNNLSGELPPALSNISTLVILQLDNNKFSGSIPSSYSTLVNLSKLSLRNCSLNGTIPDLSALPYLAYLDLSKNQLSGSLPSLRSPSDVLTTIDLSFNNLDGEVPSNYYSFLNLEFLILENNSLNGTFSANVLTHNAFPATQSILLFNLQYNNFSEFNPGGLSSVPNVTFRLFGNPVCNDVAGNAPLNSYCVQDSTAVLNLSDMTVATQDFALCSENACDEARGQEIVPGLLAQGTCDCVYPLVVGYRLKSPSFAVFPSYIDDFIAYVASGLRMEDYQVYVSHYRWEPGPRLRMTIKLFPDSSVHEFEQDQVEYLYSVFTSWSFTPNNTFGPYELLSFTIGFPYNDVSGSGIDGNSLSAGAVAGIVSAAVVFTIVVAAAMFVLRKHRHQYAVATKSGIKQHERIKVAGVKSFSYVDMARATNNFDNSMQVGQGGYGKVYRAIMNDGLVVAIKRAETGSLQGSKEFYTEIELLSRVHHRNLVSLIGYCDDEGEQMLVYEYMANGTLHDHLNSHSKAPLDFSTRLQVALGSAKGILYLHTEANPPIYHRDIKASNILLDEKRRAKVADFGISKLAPAADLEGDAGGYVSTVVKGTPGYLDPEYFYTHMLTDKSDVYSFGVVLLEIVTGMQPIYNGKNLVREVRRAKERGAMLEMVDSRMGVYPTECMFPLIELAILCSKDEMKLRPSIAEVVRTLTAIWQSTPLTDSSKFFSEASLEMEVDHAKRPSSSNPSLPSLASVPSMVTESLLSGAILEIYPR
ncbi:hypothetical protein GOP47_0008322 [Adiantum capillus-veneris]|uniref:non-specific serine/threonine protein kinase n=1 Tax=Adiantum capillus-veneris TaxID=13818 RepID=A0A9D4UZI6_ADICA|nr:hypothetical protein GOP47_0008322 [Adiantum capillus-veneris]